MSVVDSLVSLGAARELWSDSRSGRVAGAQLAAMAEVLRSQRNSEALQGTLCRLAARTNSLLADVTSSLDALIAEYGRTNDILQRSLDVQSEQLRLVKREKLLKDLLFRWTEILTADDRPTDPHWVLVAAHTLDAYLAEWQFTTQDLNDLSEKRSLMELVKKAAHMRKSTAEDVACEVGVFQALYAEHIELTANPPQAGQAEEAPDVTKPFDENLAFNLFTQIFALSPAQHSFHLMNLTNWPGYIYPGSTVKASSTSFNNNEDKPGQPLFILAMTARPFIMCHVFFTTRAWWHRNGRHEYDGKDLAFFGNYENLNPKSNAHDVVAQAKQFALGMHQLLSSHAQGIAVAQEQAERSRAERQRTLDEVAAAERIYRNDKMIKAAEAINQYLAIHPTITQFYPEVHVQQ